MACGCCVWIIGEQSTILAAPWDTNERSLPCPAKNYRLPSHGSGETYSLRLTELQRSSLIHSTRIRNKIKERLKAAGEGTQIVGVTRKELDHLNEEIGEAAVFIPDPHKKRLVAVLHQVTGLLDGERAVPFGTDTSKPRKAAPKNGAVLYQFKITLLDIKPAIWRRIQVPDCTLLGLHLCIQAAFGWWNYHLHQFLIDGRRYGLPDPEDFDFGDRMVDGSGAVLSKLIPKSGRRSRWIYEYDFGDGWRGGAQGGGGGKIGGLAPRRILRMLSGGGIDPEGFDEKSDQGERKVREKRRKSRKNLCLPTASRRSCSSTGGPRPDRTNRIPRPCLTRRILVRPRSARVGLRAEGAARLRFEDRTIEMNPGDFVNIPAHEKHRVEWTTPEEPTIWLAVHYGDAE